MSTKPLPEVTPLTKPYWDAIQERRLVMQRCRACNETIFFPKLWCPKCWSRELEWKPVSGRGTVLTYSVVHQELRPSYRSSMPYVVAIVKLTEGPQMMCNVINCSPGTVRVGLPVKVAFEERSGGFLVPQFEPAA
jgi:uncharacterized OB-fold protein